MKKDLQFMLDMLQSAELILQYTAECSRKEFIDNIQLQDSVIRRLLVIAEAAKRVSITTRQNLTDISWKEINRMQNRLVHEYDNINLNIVWNIVSQEMPILIKELKLQVPPES